MIRLPQKLISASLAALLLGVVLGATFHSHSGHRTGISPAHENCSVCVWNAGHSYPSMESGGVSVSDQLLSVEVPETVISFRRFVVSSAVPARAPPR
ncbi:MAG TPA: hypothetical protein PK876_01405 [Elusimicrobiota bacterium]|nr:hypothetical protein [Elusimicrobiota bacterium]